MTCSCRDHPLRFMCCCLLTAWSPRLQLFEEVVAFIVNKDECREVLNLNLPDCFHTEFRIFNTLDALDAVHRQNGSRTTDASQIESAVLLACVGYNLSTVTLGNHYH